MLKKISLYFTALVLVISTVGSAYAVTLKASHQWPGTPRADGSFDPRHEMVQIIADEVKKANVDIDISFFNFISNNLNHLVTWVKRSISSWCSWPLVTCF